MTALKIGFDVPFDEAIKWGRERVTVLPEVFYNTLPAQARSRAFTVSGLASLDQIQGVLDNLDRAMTSGETFATWQKSLKPEALALGKARLDNIFRTAVQTHYNVGRYQQQQANKAHRPFLMYDAINDGRTRPHHRALDNFIAPADDPIWGSIYPPNGFRCRCSTLTLTEAQAVARGWGGAPSYPSDGRADAGWEYNPAIGQDTALEQVVADKLANAHPTVAAKGSVYGNAPNPRPWSAAPDTEEGKWHDAAFGNSPQWVKDAAASRAALPGGVFGNGKGGAYYNPSTDAITMGRKIDKTNPTHQATWRHEYGHAVDFKEGAFMQRSAQADFTDAMRADAKALVDQGAHGVAQTKKLVSRRAALDDFYERSRNSFIDANDREAWLRNRYAAAGMDYDDVQRAMKKHASFPDMLEGIGRQDRYRRIVDAIEQQDAQAMMDAMTGGYGQQEAMQTWNKGALGYMSDLFGSATKNKVSGYNQSGNGHPTSYYSGKHNAGMQQTECFANLLCLYGDENPVLGQMVDRMTPNMAAVFKGIMK